jgi:hypothetical protein
MTALSWLLAFSALAVASSTKAVVTKTDQTVPGNVTVYAIDLEAGTSKAIASLAKDWTASSGAAVCGGVYYAVFTDFAAMAYGLVSVDLNRASPELKVLSTNSLFHKIACDPQMPTSLLAIGSDSAVLVDEKKRTLQPGNGASFHLKRYKPFPIASETYVATFPAKDVQWAGQDGIFAFKADGSEVWASWPADSCPDCASHKSGGHLHVMDTTNGNIKKSAKIDGGSLFSKANPYFLLPDAMRGVFDPGHAKDIFWADLTFSGNALTWKKAQPADELWSNSQPKESCQGNLLAPQVTGFSATTIFLVNPKDGSHIAAFDTSQIKTEGSPIFGAVACDETTYHSKSAQVMV